MMFFLIFSLLSLTINLVTIHFTKNVYQYDFETPLGLELDSNWKIEKENGNNVLVGVILIIMVTLDTWKMTKSQQKLSTI